MDEMSELARMRAGFPAITDDVHKRGAVALLDHTTAAPAPVRAGARRDWKRRPAPLFGGAAAVAGAVTAVVVTLVGSAVTPSPALAATLLDKAAAAAMSMPSGHAHGYVYIHLAERFGNAPVLDVQDWNPLGLGFALERTTQNGKTSDSSPWGRVTGDPSVPVTQSPLGNATYDYLLTLPTDAAALRRIVYAQARQGDTYGSNSVDQNAFRMIDIIVTHNLLPPALRAAFYKILATIPGITVIQNAVDAMGRHGTGVSDTSGAGTVKQITLTLIFDTSTHRLLGGQSRSGGFVQTSAILQTAFTGKIGQQP
jgi:hypothetical protein